MLKIQKVPPWICYGMVWYGIYWAMNERKKASKKKKEKKSCCGRWDARTRRRPYPRRVSCACSRLRRADVVCFARLRLTRSSLKWTVLCCTVLSYDMVLYTLCIITIIRVLFSFGTSWAEAGRGVVISSAPEAWWVYDAEKACWLFVVSIR